MDLNEPIEGISNKSRSSEQFDAVLDNTENNWPEVRIVFGIAMAAFAICVITLMGVGTFAICKALLS